MQKLRILIFGHDKCERPDLARQVIRSAVEMDVLRCEEMTVRALGDVGTSQIRRELCVRPPSLVYMFPAHKDDPIIDSVLLDFRYGGSSTWGVPPPIWNGGVSIPMSIGIHPYFSLADMASEDVVWEERLENLRRLAAGSNGPDLEARAKRMLAGSMR